MKERKDYIKQNKQNKQKDFLRVWLLHKRWECTLTLLLQRVRMGYLLFLYTLFAYQPWNGMLTKHQVKVKELKHFIELHFI